MIERCSPAGCRRPRSAPPAAPGARASQRCRPRRRWVARSSRSRRVATSGRSRWCRTMASSVRTSAADSPMRHCFGSMNEVSGDWILHVDLDQFLAAVEILRRPELAGQPVIVGGDGDPNRARQVVATASYEARAFGVRSGMPLRLAARRCPDGVFLPSDKPLYEAASARVMATLRSFRAVVEVWGWDEAFVGAQTDDPEDLARQIQARVLAETGLTCAVGIGETKLQAKTATGFAKPGGIGRLTRRTWMETMGYRSVTALWGVGERTATRLAELGIVTVADLAAADLDDLAKQFG